MLYRFALSAKANTRICTYLSLKAHHANKSTQSKVKIGKSYIFWFVGAVRWVKVAYSAKFFSIITTVSVIIARAVVITKVSSWKCAIVITSRYASCRQLSQSCEPLLPTSPVFATQWSEMICSTVRFGCRALYSRENSGQPMIVCEDHEGSHNKCGEYTRGEGSTATFYLNTPYSDRP